MVDDWNSFEDVGWQKKIFVTDSDDFNFRSGPEGNGKHFGSCFWLVVLEMWLILLSAPSIHMPTKSLERILMTGCLMGGCIIIGSFVVSFE